MQSRFSHALAALLLLSTLAPTSAQNPTADWQPVAGHLMTQWAKQVSPTNALPEYPRPQMTRANWQSLNGLWDYGLTDAAATTAPATYAEHILVPYPYEAALSGVGKPSIPDQRLWYHRTFTLPAAWQGQHVLLHFGAVNWDSSVAVNGQVLGTHRGGYDGFDYDITASLKPGANDLSVSAWNPVRDATQVVGKQRLHAGGIFYTATTGIWQSVWLEPVPVAHIASLKLTPDVDAGVLRVGVQIAGSARPLLLDDDKVAHLTAQLETTPPLPIRVTALDGATVVATAVGPSNTELRLAIPAAHLWTPDDPHLYTLQVSLAQGGRPGDSVGSYFAMRKISLGKDEQGRTRLFLNNKFFFEVGALDQGYWPDGIYTAPTDDALRFDIEAAKRFGMNLLRKHAKVEPARWYYWTDKLGMLVWQDMPQMYGGENVLTDEVKQQFNTEWQRIIAEHYNSPSIVVWTTFNEGWGQHDTAQVVAFTKQLDPSRLVNNASGWTDKQVGDIADTHAYPGPWSGKPEATRAAVNGEFGGVTMNVPEHRWVNNAGVMGYGATLQSSWLATKHYQNLLKTAYHLRDDQGTSAVVYTQITDVEQEINGLLTYDRAVVKLDQAIVAAANQGRFLPMPPNPNPDLVPTSQDEPINWHYTTTKPADNWFTPTFDDAAWQTGSAVFGHDAPGVRTQWTTDDIWIRRTFNLPAVIPAKLVFLAQHDEDAEIYVNGVLAATVTGFTGEYAQLPMNEAGRAALKPGQNVLAVHCHQTVGGQAIDVGITQAP